MDTAKVQQIVTDQIANQDFINALITYLDHSYDVVLESFEPQSGKTKVILTTLWLSVYRYNRSNIVFLDNKINDLRQFNQRVKEFNKLVPNYPLTKYNTIVNILHEGNIEYITTNYFRLRDRQKYYTIFFDEADASVFSVLDNTTKKRELLLRHLFTYLTEQDVVVYISATMFAVLNSPHRTLRKIKYLKVPDDIYRGLEFRGINYPTNKKIFTRCLMEIQHWLRSKNNNTDHTTLPQYFNELRKYLIEFANKPLSTSQPNIGLLNISYRNYDKHRLALLISQWHQINMIVVVYTGEDTTEYIPGIIDGQLTYHTNRYDTYIGDYLQAYKDAGRRQAVLIIATKMASRSQTYRPKDNTWKLTHLFLSFAHKPNWECLIQSFRSNGQYTKDAPPLWIYIDKEYYNIIQLVLTNKYLIANYFDDIRYCKREILEDLPLLVNDNLLQLYSKPKISRKEINDFYMEDMLSSPIFNDMAKVELFLRNMGKIYRIKYKTVLITFYYKLSLSELFYSIHTLRNFANYYHLDFTSTDPFRNMTINNYLHLCNLIETYYLRAWLCNKLGLPPNLSCLLARDEKHQVILNELDCRKNKHIRSQVIAAMSANTLAVVVYHNEYWTNPSKLLKDNDVILWHKLDKSLGIYFTKNPDYRIITIKHLNTVPVPVHTAGYI